MFIRNGFLFQGKQMLRPKKGAQPPQNTSTLDKAET
jgi:hypothetical protein